MVGATGFEPVTTRTPSVCATRLRYAPTKKITYLQKAACDAIAQFDPQKPSLCI